ncbi:hypothetical protein CJ030_MR2G016451 [Morella rubra]|uniref:Uncharacterized protein n=1 Tax=Morella rubra TaxID=262757 RepID=A0A6A1WJV1_9ROSI|nr:hypothetical protein CJ030_MR2G016451 [Morella rubra]
MEDIYRSHLSVYFERSEAQIRRQQQPQGPAPGEPQLKEQPPSHDARERPVWANAFMFDLKSQDVVMAAGGKRLRCDSGARSVGASDQTGTRAADNYFKWSRRRFTISLHRSTREAPRRVVMCDASEQNAPVLKESIRASVPNMKKEEWAPICELFSIEEFQKDAEIDQINPALMYKKTHINKDGAWTSDTAREHFEKMEALQLQRESEGRPFSASSWIIVLSVSVDLPEIGRGKNGDRGDEARQKEYDELAVRQAKMERVMREQQQHLMEQKALRGAATKATSRARKRLQLLQAEMCEQMMNM